ncbi:MAG: hypothetical protein HYV52_00975, partial [Parcubacteria group bacterium]|nr:hypothetical protein [Parcubacteria group bacterium]
NNQIFNLTSGVSISNINLNPAGADILFARVTGAPSRTGTIEILHNISQETISIIIDQAGQVGIAPQDSLPPLNTRAVDSRHVHFIYNQNVQNAVTLTLVWPDYPADNQSISFQSYLNPAKDDFDWAGTVIVNNQPQVLRIHTHSLSGVAAQFSITRDQRYNNVAMQINLDGQNLINYSAIGATTQGSAPGVIAPEPQ